MNANVSCGMQNLIGRFLFNYNLGHPEASLSLFAGGAHLRLPDKGLEATGAEGIGKVLKTLGDYLRDGAPVHRNLHLTGSPVTLPDADGKGGKGKWDTYAFEIIDGDDGSKKIEYYFTRIDGDFVTEDGQLRIKDLDWYEIYSFVPWDYTEEGDEGLAFDWSALPPLPEHKRDISAADFYGIQNVLTRYVYNARKYAMIDTFSRRDDISFKMIPFSEEGVCGHDQVAAEIERLRKLEADNNGRYILVHPVSTPVIELSEDGQSAVGQWMSYMFTVLADAFGFPGTDNRLIKRIGLVRCEFVRENGGWRIKDFDLKTLLRCPVLEFNTWTEEGRPVKDKTFMRVGLSENQWVYARPKLGGNQQFQDELPTVEGIMAYWVNAYRRGELGDHIKKHMLNSETEAVFHSRMTGRNAAPVVGTKAVYDKFSKGNFLYHHQQPAFHGGINPDVEIDADGRRATVSYFDVSHTPYVPELNSNFGETKQIGYIAPEHFDMDNCGIEHVACVHRFANYCFTFAKVDGEWKHESVQFESLLTMPRLYTRGKESRGWAGCVTDVKYPDLWEKYDYRPERKVKK